MNNRTRIVYPYRLNKEFNPKPATGDSNRYKPEDGRSAQLSKRRDSNKDKDNRPNINSENNDDPRSSERT